MDQRFALTEVQKLLEAELPEFTRWVAESETWEPEDDDEYIGFSLLEYLRLWLLEHRGRRHQGKVSHAFELVEKLTHTNDPGLQNGLVVGLLEGFWPRRHIRLMGPRTVKLLEFSRTPAWESPDWIFPDEEAPASG